MVYEAKTWEAEKAQEKKLDVGNENVEMDEWNHKLDRITTESLEATGQKYRLHIKVGKDADEDVRTHEQLDNENSLGKEN